MRLSLRLLTGSGLPKAAMELQEVVKRLNNLAPLSLAGSWDNVGLLVQPPSQQTVSQMLLTNDLTEQVLEEALTLKADFILSYHPPVFSALKRITMAHWKQRIVGRCLEKGVAVYSPHTAYDALLGGVNDWLVTAFGEADVTPVEQSSDPPPQAFEIKLFEKPQDQHIQYLTSTLANAKIVPSTDACSILCSLQDLNCCVALLSTRPALSAVKYVINKCESIPRPGYGMGRLASLKSTKTISDVVTQLKEMTGLSHVRLALGSNHTLDSLIRTGAVCAGSGASVLRGVRADLVVSGEMGHHDVLELAQCGHSVVLLEHSNSERGFLKAVLQPQLAQLFQNKISVVVSNEDKDPLQIV